MAAFLDFKKNEGKNNCEKECPLECSSIEFSIEKSFAGFPSREYAEELMDNDFPTYESLQQSLLHLDIKYNVNIEYTTISEKEAVTLIDMIANIGGTLGLFIGISLLSFVELVEILIKIGSIIIKNKVKSIEMCKNQNEYVF